MLEIQYRHWVRNIKNSLIAYMGYFCWVPNKSRGSIRSIQKLEKIIKILISGANQILLRECGPLIMDVMEKVFPCHNYEEGTMIKGLRGLQRIEFALRMQRSKFVDLHKCKALTANSKLIIWSVKLWPSRLRGGSAIVRSYLLNSI